MAWLHSTVAPFPLHGTGLAWLVLTLLTCFGFPLAKVVNSTWYGFWYILRRGSKQAGQILKSDVKPLQTTDWSEGMSLESSLVRRRASWIAKLPSFFLLPQNIWKTKYLASRVEVSRTMQWKSPIVKSKVFHLILVVAPCAIFKQTLDCLCNSVSSVLYV